MKRTLDADTSRQSDIYTVAILVAHHSKAHGSNMGHTWGRQDPGGPHVGHMNFAIWEAIWVVAICYLAYTLIVPVPVKQSWRMSVNESYESARTDDIITRKGETNRVYIYGTCCIMIPLHTMTSSYVFMTICKQNPSVTGNRCIPLKKTIDVLPFPLPSTWMSCWKKKSWIGGNLRRNDTDVTSLQWHIALSINISEYGKHMAGS